MAKKRERKALGSTQKPTARETAEASSVAREMANSYRRMVQYLQRGWQKSPEEADQEARKPATVEDRQRLVDAPPDQISWFSLSALAESEPELAYELWRGMKQAAREELISGHRTADALDVAVYSSPWDRARFLATVKWFEDEWQPRGGIEASLIEMLAAAHDGWLEWLHVLKFRTTLGMKHTEQEEEFDRRWLPPRLSDADAVEEAMAMAERFNRMFLRTLRALRDLRRYPVVVQNAGPVNVADQQVNVRAEGRP